ncbi:hypothetical protein [Oceanicola sp. 502str15]|uniref:hypothetical protein n=1 Tax=Oceanicola sp. 502str15 TaxID=2696061 RepID=UPI0020943E6C|nr:hypothetical protein [Oceanicola sp. 502str15]MCO6383264.1 hypothetical protein [Oceanicola sp. 502str15]
MIAGLKATLKRPRVRAGLTIAGFAVLALGAVWAIATMDLTWSDLSPLHLLLNLALLTPVLLAVSALSLKVTFGAMGRELSIATSLHTVAAANVAELLPLPGGALVRGAALVKAGARVGEAARVVLLTAFLTLGLTLALSAFALGLLTDPIWHWIAAAALAGVGLVLFMLSRHAAPRYLLAMVAVRLLSLFVTTLRLIVAFAALGTAIGWIEALLYSAAPTVGAAVGIVPAGLGINEAIAAGLATLVSGSSATAFLAVALNRALGLAVGAAMALGGSLWGPRA